MKSLAALLLFSVSVLLVGCHSTTDDCPYCLTRDYIKTRTMLYDGNEWSYRVEQWNEDGSLLTIDTLHRAIHGHKDQFGYFSDTVEILDNGDTSGSTLAYVSETDYGAELYVINNANTNTPEVTLFLRDLNSDQPYLLRDSQYVQSGDTLIDRQVLTRIAYDTIITVPAGSFHCLRLKRDQYGGNYKNPERRYTIDFFLGKFTGLVREVDSALNNSGTAMNKFIEPDLISYHLK